MEREIEKQQQYASKVLSVMKDSLVVEYPYLARAIYELEPLFVPGEPYGTDGKNFLCSPDQILNMYLEDVSKSEEIFLHSVLHCLYLHPFLCKDREQELWDLSCDVFVYAMVRLLDAEGAHVHAQRESVLKVLEKEIGQLSAQGIYRYFLHQDENYHILGMDVQELAMVFSVDEHICWYRNEEEESGDKGKDGGSREDKDPEKEGSPEEDGETEKGGSPEEDGETEKEGSPEKNGDTREDRSPREGRKFQENRERIRRWSDIAEYAEAGLAVNLEKRLRDIGDQAGNFLDSLRNICGENKKYSEFLKQFAVLEERMLVDLDNFDYIYYTYGMQLYEDTPLIEPLEYKEVKTVHEFVIAIDTSGSCDLDLVRKFLMKTYDILSDVTIFEGKLQVYILQCDAQIQQETVIHSIEEMKEYAEHVEIYGRGGTDFRPVFERVRELREEGKLTNVRGLLYFTDGYGIYPKLPTDYKTAFIFVETYGQVEVPSWAMKVYIEDETDL